MPKTPTPSQHSIKIMNYSLLFKYIEKSVIPKVNLDVKNKV